MSNPPSRFASITILAIVHHACLPGQSPTWSQATPAISPPARFQHAAAYDAQRQVVVLFGGFGTLRDTWEFDGGTWRLVNNQDPRPPGFGSMSLGMVFDSHRTMTVLVWCDSPSSRTETWEWNGTSWALRSTTGPPGRFGFAVAYDSLRRQTVLFGGRSGRYGDHADTWEWNGVTWQQRSNGGPRPRMGPAMCFDSARGVVVLHGGRGDDRIVEYSDTWEWNGIYWLERFGVASPPFRRGHVMAFDPVTARSMLFGGWDDVSPGTLFDETWSWDGTSWSQHSLPVRPGPRVHAAMVHDAARQRMTLFGGESSGALADTWHFAFLPGNGASFTPFGTGCAGPAGVPTLAAVNGSLPRLGGTLSLRLSGMPASPLNLAIGALGTDNTSWNGRPLPMLLDPFGFTGCHAWIAPEASYVLTNNGGTAAWNITVPFLPVLLGVNVYAQGIVVVPGWNPGGIITTNAGHAIVGR